MCLNPGTVTTGFGYKLQRLETLVDKQQVAIFSTHVYPQAQARAASDWWRHVIALRK